MPLARRQAAANDDRIEAQPGKILHTHWNSPPTRPRFHLPPVADGTTYCGFDQTFLFVIAASRFLRAFPDTQHGTLLFEATHRATDWILGSAIDRTSGLCAYERRSTADPVLHQVWKDSFDSVTHAGFDVPPAPLAWIDVQGYGHLR